MALVTVYIPVTVSTCTELLLYVAVRLLICYVATRAQLIRGPMCVLLLRGYTVCVDLYVATRALTSFVATRLEVLCCYTCIDNRSGYTQMLTW